MTDDDTPTSTDLRARIAQLEAENASLREKTQLTAPPPPVSSPSTPRKTGRWRPFVALLLIVIGSLLAPLAVISGWGKATLVDTDRFVATYAPLAQDPAVQAYVVNETMTVINNNININQLTSEVIDGIKGLGVPPRASSALDLLKAPAAQGIQSTMRSGVQAFVTSDAFATAWQQALRVSHTQLMATLSGDPNALVTAQADGTIGIQLGPIIADIKQALLDRGISIASRIPEVNRTIPLAQSQNLPTIQLGYRGVVAAGTWLPWVALIMIAAGVLVAKRRARTLIWAAVALAAVMAVLLIGFVTGRAVLLTTLPPSLVPTNVTTLLYDTATTDMKDTATATLVVAVVVALIAWLAGPFVVPRRLRGLYLDGVSSLRGAAESRGVTTGKVGTVIYAQRRVLHTLVAVGAAVAILLLRPLTIGEIIATLAVALGVLIILSLVERPPHPVDEAVADQEMTIPLPPAPSQ
jgi:hypothetical protein